MKLMIEISEEEIRETVLSVIAERAAKEVEKHLYIDDWGNRDRKIYTDAIKTSIREMMKPHVDDIVARATEAAAYQIERKGIRKMLEENA